MCERSIEAAASMRQSRSGDANAVTAPHRVRDTQATLLTFAADRLENLAGTRWDGFAGAKAQWGLA